MGIDSVADIVRTRGAAKPDALAIRFGDRDVTWEELDRRSNQVAQALLGAGVGAGDRVAFLDRNAVEHFEVQFGALKIGAVSVDVNWRLAPPEVAHVVTDAEAKVLIVGQELVPVIDAGAEALTAVPTIVVVGGHPQHPDYDTWLAPYPAVDPGVTPGAADVALQLYSSGTTGLPKGVMLTNSNLLALIPTASEMWGINADSVSLVAMPLFHIGGGGWALVGMYHGCPTILVRELDPAALVSVIGEQRVTCAFLVPALLQFMLMVPGVDKADFASLDMILYGASPISTQVLTGAIRTFKCRFVQAYGLTETTGAVVILPPEDHDPDGPNRHRLRAAGKAMPGVELRIVEPDTGADAPVGEVGEVWIKTAQNMAGYWRMPEATDAAFVDGWFRSGDIGYLDADGYLYIHDRVKDMIVSGGENIYPAEIENVLMAHPAVADAAVIGVPDETWGETPLAIVVLATGAAFDADELISFCRERLAHYKCPRAVTVADALPRNPSGKILKKDLRAPYWEGRTRKVN